MTRMTDPASDDERPHHVVRVTPAAEWKRVARSAADQVAVAQQLLASPAFQQMLESAAQAQRALQTSVVRTVVESYTRLWDQLRPSIEMAFRAMADALPPNWDDVDLGAAVDLAEQGWPIVWFPSSGIVAKLVAAASDDERDASSSPRPPRLCETCSTRSTASQRRARALSPTRCGRLPRQRRMTGGSRARRRLRLRSTRSSAPRR
jgi:hypothetical protein